MWPVLMFTCSAGILGRVTNHEKKTFLQFGKFFIFALQASHQPFWSRAIVRDHFLRVGQLPVHCCVGEHAQHWPGLGEAHELLNLHAIDLPHILAIPKAGIAEQWQAHACDQKCAQIMCTSAVSTHQAGNTGGAECNIPPGP